MLYFNVSLQNKGKMLSLGIISLAYIKCYYVSLLEPRQNNLSNPETYLEPCKTSKVEHFAKIVNS